jgi:hypothetical protein
MEVMHCATQDVGGRCKARMGCSGALGVNTSGTSCNAAVGVLFVGAAAAAGQAQCEMPQCAYDAAMARVGHANAQIAG